MLGAAREVVADEQRDILAAFVLHGPGARVLVVKRHVGGCEGQTEQAARGFERRLDHLVQLEVRLDLGLVEIELGLAAAFGVIAPVVRRQREVAALVGNDLLHGVALGERLGAGAGPDVFKQFPRGTWRLRHLVGEPVVGEGVVAQQMRALGAQGYHLSNNGAVVGLAAVLAALDPRVEDLLAQIAARGELQERLNRGTRQREGVLARVAALFRRSSRAGAGEVGQAVEIGFVQDQRVGPLVGQHVLAELGPERREPLVDGGELVLCGLLQCRARAHEAAVVAIEHACLFGCQPEPIAAGVKVGDAGVERAVEIERVVVAGEQRRDVALDFLDLIAGIGAGQHEEHGLHLVERTAGALQLLNGVLKGGCFRIGGDCLDLGAVLRERRIEGRTEVLRRERAEGRQPEGTGPLGEQGILGGRSVGIRGHLV